MVDTKWQNLLQVYFKDGWWLASEFDDKLARQKKSDEEYRYQNIRRKKKVVEQNIANFSRSGVWKRCETELWSKIYED